MSDDRIVIGQESLSISGVSAVITDSVGEGNIRIHSDGFAHPDMINLIAAGIACVAKGIESVKVLVLCADY